MNLRPRLLIKPMRHSAMAVALAAAAIAARTAGAGAQVSLLSNTVEEHAAALGERYSGTIVVSNPTDKLQTLRLYQTDYRFSADGTSNFDQPGTLPRSNASWITLQTTRVTVPAGARVSIAYTVAVPTTDSLRGSYWSTIMVEGTPTEAPSVAGAPQLGLSAVMRYAVQVETHVGTGAKRGVEFSKPTASHTDQARFDLDVTNTGEQAYRPVMWIEVYDSTGVVRGKARQVRGLVYPGSSFHQQFALGALPAGKYKAIVFADIGDVAVAAKQFTVSY